MRGGLAFGLVASWLSAAGCGVQLDGGQQGTPDGNQMNPDSPVGPTPDAMVPLGPWGDPKPVVGASSALAEDDASLSSNTNEMVFSVTDAVNGGKDLWYMSRPSSSGLWSAPERLPFNVTGVSDETPRFSPDDKTLYFASARAGGKGGLDIYKVSRGAVGSKVWEAPVHLFDESTPDTDKWFMPCATGNSYLVILGNHIGEGTRGSQPTLNAQLSSLMGVETGTFLSPDCKTAYFASTTSGIARIYVSTRPAIGGTWSAPEMVVDFLAVGGAQEDPWLSANLKTFVFVSNGGTGNTKDVYVSTR